ncbi:restriction endonuclease subunit S [Roseibacillus persicicus]|uniref:Type I restriction modification DNA specificity domain-containing protein n=1 Tax=Roseibacillus persicicus TaxID=454148 RepID=A0A918TQ33_9BACT|nr:restriction endonuclease subunit S [Roseibacillus persicicus]GHC57526.1 hypothetical protein GCM10007100_25620 [Roseibacillus persicicus]
MSELPKGWKRSTVADALIIIDYRGRTPPYSETGIPHLRSANVRDGKIVWEKLRYVTEDTYEQYMTRGIPKVGDLLFTTEAPLGHVADVPDQKFCLAQRVMVLRTDHDELHPRFLKYQIMSPEFQGRISGRGTGTTVTGISSRNFKPVPLLLPPLPEQRRIVARIEELFSRLDAGVAALRHAKAQLQRYRQSVLAAAVTGQLTQDWREQHPDTEPAEELINRISETRAALFRAESENSEVKRHVSKHKRHKFTTPPNWTTPPSWKFTSLLTSCQFVVDCHNKTPPYENSGIPLIRTTNVRNGKLAWPKMKFVNKETAAHWSQRCTPEPGDILFTREAPAGEAAIIPENTRLCMGQRMMLFRTFHDLLLPSYLLTVIRSHNFQSQYGEKQVGVGVQHLRVGDVESLALPLPPLPEQHQIVAEVEARTTAIDHLEAELDRQLTRATRLRQSTLATAFSGKL